jgi:hypothetical protein
MMNPQFMIHNLHLESPDEFKTRDPAWRMLNKQIYSYNHPLVQNMTTSVPGIYTITGGRQIGKTTLVKQWMAHLLGEGVNPKSIAYFTGELIVDHLSMIQQLQNYLATMPQNSMQYIILDEVTYIQNWDMGAKFLADAGLLENVMLVLTGSDSVIIQEARMRFPGRRGKAHQVDYHIYPLSFYEVLKLTQAVDNLDEVLLADGVTDYSQEMLYQAFDRYLVHGGYLTAINNFAAQNKIEKSVLDTYADRIRGDVIKRGKSDHHCREFFTAMQNRLSSQVTWTALAKDFSIQHHNTVADYAALFASMDVIFIQQTLLEDKLMGAPKKARKLVFTDPFIYHAIKSWLVPSREPFHQQILTSTADPAIAAYLVESCVTSHICRWYPTYYIKAEGEVDLAYIKDKKFWPIEIKWTSQLRPKDLKQIQKYSNGIILGKQRRILPVQNIWSYPLPWYLAKIAQQEVNPFATHIR